MATIKQLSKRCQTEVARHSLIFVCVIFALILAFILNTTIKSTVRKLLHTIIGKFNQKQEEKNVEFAQKKEYLRTIMDFLG